MAHCVLSRCPAPLAFSPAFFTLSPLAALSLLCLPLSFFSVRHSPPRFLSPVRNPDSARGNVAPPKRTRSPCSARFARPLSSRCSRPLQPSIAIPLCSPATSCNQSIFSAKGCSTPALLARFFSDRPAPCSHPRQRFPLKMAYRPLSSLSHSARPDFRRNTPPRANTTLPDKESAQKKTRREYPARL